MKKLILVLVLLFSNQINAHAQSCINEGGAPLTQPNAQEMTSVNDVQQAMNEGKNGGQPVLIEFYKKGCCLYNGEVETMNQLIQIYGSSLRVIEVRFDSPAGQTFLQFTNNVANSPQFQLFTHGEGYLQQGPLQATLLLKWINDRTGLGGASNGINVNGNGPINVNGSSNNGCPN